MAAAGAKKALRDEGENFMVIVYCFVTDGFVVDENEESDVRPPRGTSDGLLVWS